VKDSVLVIGGAGYIGSHVCKALWKDGFLPVTFDNLSQGHEWAVKWGPLVMGDIRERQVLEKAIATHRPIGVIHLASHIEVRESIVEPAKYYHNNLLATFLVLETLKQCGINHLVFSSSAAVYGKPSSDLLIVEDHSKEPVNPYGKTKWMAEQMMDDFSRAYGLKVAILRYFNAAGADLDGEIGEAHDPETHLIPLAIQAALGKIPHLTVYGESHATQDGTQVRDFIHVVDLAQAHVEALKTLYSGTQKLTVNLGTGKGHSVRQIIDGIERHCKIAVPHQIGSCSQDPPMLVADASLAEKLLNWKPVHSDLPTILETAWNWYNTGRG
jgi:UDP-arabinose 4-epimerase